MAIRIAHEICQRTSLPGSFDGLDPNVDESGAAHLRGQALWGSQRRDPFTDRERLGIGRDTVGIDDPITVQASRSAVAVASSAGRNASMLSSAAVRSSAVPNVVTVLTKVSSRPSGTSNRSGTTTPPRS